MRDSSSITNNEAIAIAQSIGDATAQGGGVANVGDSTLDMRNNSSITLNKAEATVMSGTATQQGGGVFNSATLVNVVDGGNVNSNIPDDVFQQ